VDDELARRRAERSAARGGIAAALREHATALGVLLAFVVAGPLVVSWTFPEVSPWVGVAGGLALGIWAALSAVPGHFYGD